MRTIATILALTLAATLCATPRHALLLREAAAAAKAGDSATALTRLEEAAQLRPDYPRIQLNLARTYASLNRTDDALAALQRLADMGLLINVAADPALAVLKDSPAFQAIANQLSGATAPAPAGEAALTIPGVEGIIESCLVDPVTHDWYFGDVRNRCIWQRDAGTGTLRKFTSDEDALDGVFKIALSTDHTPLWAATAAVAAMTGPASEAGQKTGVVAIDFATGRVRTRHAVPTDGRPHLLGDFVSANDGSIYATDSLSPVIWRLPPGGDHLELWHESAEFMSLQGLAFSADERILYVADYANGIWRIDVTAKTPVLLTAPANATFFGLDGLYAVPGGLLAVQNGVNPQRVLRIELPPVGSSLGTSTARSSQAPTLQRTPSPARVVASGRPDMTDLALGEVFNGRFHFVGNSGWALFDPLPDSPPPARAVTIYSTALE